MQTPTQGLTGCCLPWRRTLYSLQTVWVIGDTYLIWSVIASLPGCFWRAEKGNPEYKKWNKTSAPLLCSTHSHSAVAAQFSAWMLLQQAKGCPYEFTQAKWSNLYSGKRPSMRAVTFIQIHDFGFSSVLQVLLLAEKTRSKAATTATVRLLQRASGYQTKGAVGRS